MNLQQEYRNTVPLVKVVKAAIVDVHGDIGVLQQQYSHWAGRGLEKLQRETLKHGKRKVLLQVSRNTLTAVIPIDCGGVIFLGFIDEDGRRIPLKHRSDVMNAEDIEIIKESKCPKCGQDKAICNELQLSEEINLIVIGDSTYEETITKRVYPNGDYFVERTTPTLNIENNTVENEYSKEFITNIDLKECGCPDNTQENLEVINKYLPDIYACHYAPLCNCAPREYGSIRVNEDTGFISVSPDYPFPYIYMEYWAFMPKMNGQYVVPRVAFETLVEWTKFKEVENKRSVSLSERNWYLQNYIRERKNMEKVMGKVSLSMIIQAFGLTPKFGFNGNSPTTQIVKSSCSSSGNSEAAPQNVIQTIVEVKETTSDIAYGKLQFEIGNVLTNPPMNDGDTQLVINVAGIMEDSVEITLDSVPLTEGLTDQSSYSVSYDVNSITIDFTDAVSDGQKYKITYTKKVTA